MVRWNIVKVVDELDCGIDLIHFALDDNDHWDGNWLFFSFCLLVTLHHLLVLSGIHVEAVDETRPAVQVTVAFLLPALLHPCRIL